MTSTHKDLQLTALIANRQRLKTIRTKYGRCFVQLEKIFTLIINDNATAILKNYLLSDS